jgi:hypothetical protein
MNSLSRARQTMWREKFGNCYAVDAQEEICGIGKARCESMTPVSGRM